ncbi:MAG: DUF4401 domain-containing protein [Kiloniellales bacterium]|nr:DUF4401 domain-containing protein [Kiloniellales bacterium]
MSESAALQAQRGLPWYVALLHGLGGLLAGVLLTGFLAFTLLENLDPPAFGVAGAVLIGTGTAIAGLRSYPFVRLFALSLSLSGHAALGFYLLEEFEFDGLVAALVVLSAGLYLVYRDALHRFLSVLVTLAVVSAWVLSGETVAPNAIHGVLLIVAAAGVWCFSGALSEAVRPIGYAAVVTLLVLPLLVLVPREHADIDWWAARAVAVVSGLFVLGLIRRAYPGFPGAMLSGSALAVAAIGAVTTPGLAFAIAVLVLGFWRGERILTLLGLLFLPLFLIVFYYALEITLLDKSLMLMAGGALFLSLRQGLILWERRQIAVGGGGG